MSKENNYQGTWWLPKAKKEKIQGTLTRDSEGRTTLSLYGDRKLIANYPLTSLCTVGNSNINNIPLIMGSSDNGTLISLVDSFTTLPSWNFGRFKAEIF